MIAVGDVATICGRIWTGFEGGNSVQIAGVAHWKRVRPWLTRRQGRMAFHLSGNQAVMFVLAADRAANRSAGIGHDIPTLSTHG